MNRVQTQRLRGLARDIRDLCCGWNRGEAVLRNREEGARLVEWAADTIDKLAAGSSPATEPAIREILRAAVPGLIENITGPEREEIAALKQRAEQAEAKLARLMSALKDLA